MPHNNEDTEIIKFTHNGNNVSTYTKTKIDTLLSAYVLNSASTQFAGNANTATNAQNDGSGNNIENTYATKQWVEGKNYLTTITSGMITSALGFTPANSSSLNNYLLKSSDKVYSLGSHFFVVNTSDATYQYCKLCTIVSTGDNGSTSQIYCTVHEGWNYVKNQKNSYCLEISCDFSGSITNISDSSLLRHLGGSNSCKFYIARRGSNYKICDVYVEFRKTSWISVSVHVTGDVQTYVDSWGEPVSSLPTTVENQIYVSSAITCGSLIDSSDLNNYLPLSGGTISSGRADPLLINSTSNDDISIINFLKNSNYKSSVGYAFGMAFVCGEFSPYPKIGIVTSLSGNAGTVPVGKPFYSPDNGQTMYQLATTDQISARQILIKEFDAYSSSWSNVVSWIQSNRNIIISIIYYEYSVGNSGAISVSFNTGTSTYKYLENNTWYNVNFKSDEDNGDDEIKIYYRG